MFYFRGFYQNFKCGIIMGIGVLMAGTACTSSKGPDGANDRSKVRDQARIVNLAIWSNYISPELLAEFEKKTGIAVRVSNYSSNEELLAKLQAGASGYDIVVPSDYMVFAMTKLGLLRELDFSLIPNSAGVSQKLLKKAYDPQNKYSIPYDWGTTGVAVNRTLYSGELKSWKDLFEKDDLSGKLSLLDDAREVIGAALRSVGYSLNSKNPEELNQAKEVLLKARKRVKAFTSEPLMPLVSGEIAVAQIFTSDALQARKARNGQIDYLIPDEGGTLWIDNLVIPKTAGHPAEAHALINFLLEPSVNAALVRTVWVSPAVESSISLLPKEIQENKMLFPPDSILAKCEMVEDIGEALVLWDRIWTEVKASH